MALKTIIGYFIIGIFFISVASSSINIHNSISLNTRNALNNQNNLNTQNQPLLNKRIVNGIPAEVNQFQYQVRVLMYIYDDTYDSYLYCGGVILTSRHVISAAHCFVFVLNNRFFDVEPSAIKVEAGHVYVYEMREFWVEQIDHHPFYSFSTFDYDISIIKLKSEFPLNANGFQTINLINSAVPDATKCVISGWGRHFERINDDFDGKLLYTNVYIVNHKQCVEMHSDSYRPITHRMICAMYSGKISGRCLGDSGGPLTCNGELAGIISWGNGCGQPKYPGVYVDVYELREWILSKIENSEE